MLHASGARVCLCFGREIRLNFRYSSGDTKILACIALVFSFAKSLHSTGAVPTIKDGGI